MNELRTISILILKLGFKFLLKYSCFEVLHATKLIYFHLNRATDRDGYFWFCFIEITIKRLHL